MPRRTIAVLDACVLFPAATTDALIGLAAAGFFVAKWTRRIETEWMRALKRRRPDLSGRLISRRDAMRSAIPDWEVSETLMAPTSVSGVLPDPDDAHVVEAAVASGAEAIISANVDDFLETVLNPLSIRLWHPDQFLCELLELEEMGWVETFASIRMRLKQSELTPQEFARAFERAGLPNTASQLLSRAHLL